MSNLQKRSKPKRTTQHAKLTGPHAKLTSWETFPSKEHRTLHDKLTMDTMCKIKENRTDPSKKDHP